MDFSMRRVASHYKWKDLFCEKLLLLIDDIIKKENEYNKTYGNDEYSTTEYISFLYELYIIALYKQTEINLKTIANILWNADQKPLHEWKKLVNVYKSNKIELKKINGYKEVNELRLLNNCIKHSGFVSTELRSANKKWKLKTQIIIDYEEIKRLEFYIEIFYKELPQLVNTLK